MKEVTMYKTESGKVFDTAEQANFAEAKELLREKLIAIAHNVDVSQDELDGFLRITENNTNEIIEVLTQYQKRIHDDLLPF